MSGYITITMIAGTAIEDACKFAVRASKRLNIPVVFDFNGISIMVFGSSDWKEKVQAYHREIEKEESK